MTKLDLHYTDPRLVDLYDIENPHGADFDFFLGLADDLAAKRILDLGCGTGLLTRQLAVAGREVIGVDPAPAMLAYARKQPEANRVTWIEGDSSALGTTAADLVLMTSNVAQVFLDDAEWDTVLRHVHAALRPGGHLAFESRNPDDRSWGRWTPENTFAQLETPYGAVKSWLEVVKVANGRVHFKGHNIFKNSGEDLVARSELRFRSHGELTTSLNNAGFTVEKLYGDWKRGPFVKTSRIMVFVARRD